MHESCSSCGNDNDELATLTALPTAGVGPDVHVSMCMNCMADHEAATWDLDRPEGQRVMDALLRHPDKPGEHFAFLTEGDSRLHLLDMRMDWFRRHASGRER